MTEPMFGEPVDVADEPVVPDFKASQDSPTGRLFGRGRDRAREPRATRVKASKPAPAYQPGAVYESALKLYGGFGLVMMPIRPAVAMTVLGPAKAPTEDNPTPISVAENCAQAWEDAAKVYPWVRKFFEVGTNAALIAALLTAHLPIAMAFLEGTELGAKLNPAEAMERFLREREENKEAE